MTQTTSRRLAAPKQNAPSSQATHTEKQRVVMNVDHTHAKTSKTLLAIPFLLAPSREQGLSGHYTRSGVRMAGEKTPPKKGPRNKKKKRKQQTRDSPSQRVLFLCLGLLHVVAGVPEVDFARAKPDVHFARLLGHFAIQHAITHSAFAGLRVFCAHYGGEGRPRHRGDFPWIRDRAPLPRRTHTHVTPHPSRFRKLTTHKKNSLKRPKLVFVLFVRPVAATTPPPDDGRPHPMVSPPPFELRAAARLGLRARGP